MTLRHVASSIREADLQGPPGIIWDHLSPSGTVSDRPRLPLSRRFECGRSGGSGWNTPRLRPKQAPWALSPLGPAYVHLGEGPFVLNPFTHPDSTGPDGLRPIADGTAGAAAVGALFIAPPDLPLRLRWGGPCSTADPVTFYGGDERGVADCPTLGRAPRNGPGA